MTRTKLWSASSCVLRIDRYIIRGTRCIRGKLTHGSGLTGPEPFAQCALEDFAGAGLRQLEIGELDATWNLVTGQRSTAVRDQLIHTERGAGFQHDTRHDQLTPLGIGDAEHRGLANGRMFVEDSLDLAGIDVLAAGDDHVLHA